MGVKKQYPNQTAALLRLKPSEMGIVSCWPTGVDQTDHAHLAALIQDEKTKRLRVAYIYPLPYDVEVLYWTLSAAHTSALTALRLAAAENT